MGKLELAATLATIIGYFLICQGLQGLGICVSLAGQVCWGIWAINEKANGIFIVNVVLGVSGITGLIKIFIG